MASGTEILIFIVVVIICFALGFFARFVFDRYHSIYNTLNKTSDIIDETNKDIINATLV